MTRLLLVDDDAALVAQLRHELESERYDVTSAPDGATALAEFERCPPDVVVLDWGLRGTQDGIEVLRRIRRRAPTPVLMLTARGGLEEKLIGFETGANDYLVKPFARAELLARLKALARRFEEPRAPLAPPPPLADGDVLLDRAAHRVLVAGKPIDVTKGELALLEILLAHPDRAFHRGYLVDRLRGADYMGSERAIDNLVARVRRKLGRRGERIETVFGIGYRWARERR